MSMEIGAGVFLRHVVGYIVYPSYSLGQAWIVEVLLHGQSMTFFFFNILLRSWLGWSFRMDGRHKNLSTHSNSIGSNLKVL